MPCLLFDGAGLVKTVQFRNPQYVGDPLNAIRIFNEKEVDELIVLDITASRKKRAPAFELVRACASECFMPLTYGGGITSLEDFAKLYKLGVEKVVVNTLCLTRPDIVRDAVKHYGSTSVVAAVDFRRGLFGKPRLYSASGARTERTPLDHCKFVAHELGAGEVFLNSVDRDGTWSGYDLEMVQQVVSAVTVPVIACGGAGSVADIRAVLYDCGANAAAIGSMAVYQKKGRGVLINFPRREDVITDA
jgi:cyclase